MLHLRTQEPPVSTVQRGKDGHITLATKGGDFFSGGSGGVMGGSGGMGKLPAGSSNNSRRGTTDTPPQGWCLSLSWLQLLWQQLSQ